MDRYGVYPLVGDQCQFDDELYSGHDKVAATLTAKRSTKAHPLGVILLDRKTGNGWGLARRAAAQRSSGAIPGLRARCGTVV